MISFGQAKIGASESIAYTLKVHCELNPFTSIASNVTVVVSSGNNEPLFKPLIKFTELTPQLSDTFGAA